MSLDTIAAFPLKLLHLQRDGLPEIKTLKIGLFNELRRAAAAFRFRANPMGIDYLLGHAPAV